MRTAMLGDALRGRGHEIMWWSTNFFHPTKTFLAPGYQEIEIDSDYEIRLLEGIPYRKNLSLRRYLHYKRLGTTFSRMHDRVPKPDLIVTALPDYDLSASMVEYAEKNRIPILVDVQDLWPDIFVNWLPTSVRWAGRKLLSRDFKKVARLLQKATGIVACSSSYLDWGLAKAGRKRWKNDAVFLHGYPNPRTKLSTELKSGFVAQLKALEGKIVFTFIGTFGRSYDIELLIGAAKELQERNDIAFVLAGLGEKYAWAEKESEGVRNVTLTGWLKEDEIAALLGKSHVGLMAYTPTAPQSLSYKPFEYMAYGLFLLSSLKGEMHELIEKHGIGATYQAGNSNDFVSQVEKIAADKVGLEVGAERARKAYSEYFSEERVYGDYADHVEKVSKGIER